MKNRVKEMRFARMVTRRALSESTGVTYGTILRMENQPELPVREKTKFAVSKALDMPVNELFPIEGDE